MHPEQVQISSDVNVMDEKHMKPQEILEDDIDVEEVEIGDSNGEAIEEPNGNGYHHEENGHSKVETEKHEFLVQPELSAANGADKSILRVKSSRRNSTSSRSSSVSSAPSVKHHIPPALQMEVSVDEKSREDMPPLIIEGTAEDLEVSISGSHGDIDEIATTDSETTAEMMRDPHDPYEFEDETSVNFRHEPLSRKSVKAVKSPSKPKADVKVSKSKTPRTKSLKLKESKAALKMYEDVDTENSDTNSVTKDDTEFEDHLKQQKSPSRRSKVTPAKHDRSEDADLKTGESEHAPRRSSRPRQTPQKYNSSLYVDSIWEHPVSTDDRLNNSDAISGGAIRSVKGRRSLRKSRNLSALNSSVHNDSSPWDNEFKVLTPSGGGVSLQSVSVGDVESSTPLKRKASDEDGDDYERDQKKFCDENAALNNSTSSQTSSFFSVITSPIFMLKNKLRGSSLNSSTPLKDSAQTEKELDGETEEKISSPISDLPGNVAEEGVAAVEQAQMARSWCTVM